MARSSSTTVVLAAVLLIPLAASLAYHQLNAPTEAVTVAVSSPAPVLAAPATVVAQPPVAPVSEPVAAKPVEPVVQPVAAEPVEPVQPVVAAEPVEPVEPIVAAGDEGAPKFAGREALLLHDGQLVVVTNPDLAWAKGRGTATPIDDGFKVRRPVDPTKLPEPVQAVVGGSFALYSADGSSCVATATGLSIYGQETDQSYADEGERMPSRSRARELADELASYAHVVEARLSAPSGCTGIWARSADLPAPIVFARQSDDGRLRVRVRTLLASRPGVLAIENEHRDYLAQMDEEFRRDEEPWEILLDKSFSFERWDEVGGPRSFITAQFSTDDGCGGFSAESAAIFELVGDELVLHSDDGFMDPSALMDIDRDGKLEAVSHNGEALWTRGDGSLARDYSFPATFCPC